MNKVFGFVLGLISIATAGAGTSDSSTSPTSNLLTAEQAVEYVCSVTKVDCSLLGEEHKLTLALVKMDNTQALGMFIGLIPDTVFVDVNSTNRAEINAIIIHEVAHYLDYHYGFTGWTDSCSVEGFAYEISNLYSIEHGLAAYARWDWRDFYPGCAVTTEE